MLKLLLAALVVGTWNGRWFPSGRAEHRAPPAVEEATLSAAARMLSEGLAAVDPMGTNDVILVLNEMRNRAVVTNLLSRIGRTGLTLASISAYRRRDRFDPQQDAIATTLPVVDSGWCRWKRCGLNTPPRGYAFAELRTSPSVTTKVFAVHLKSNYRAKDEEVALNRRKRTLAIQQILAAVRPHRGRTACAAVVAGDFNADKYARAFADEELFELLSSAAFVCPLDGLPSTARGTHDGGRWGESTLDYVMARGLRVVGDPVIQPCRGLSDHRALFTVWTAQSPSR